MPAISARAVSARRQVERQAHTDALVVAMLTIVATLISVYDLFILALGLR